MYDLKYKSVLIYLLIILKTLSCYSMDENNLRFLDNQKEYVPDMPHKKWSLKMWEGVMEQVQTRKEENNCFREK